MPIKAADSGLLVIDAEVRLARAVGRVGVPLSRLRTPYRRGLGSTAVGALPLAPARATREFKDMLKLIG
jgi:hypothetical protein